MEGKCEFCDKGFIKRRSEQRFCSRACVGKSQRRRVKVACSECSKEIERMRKDVKKRTHFYCSEKCRRSHYQVLFAGENNPNYQASGRTESCVNCGRGIRVTSSWEYNSDGTRKEYFYCSMRCKGAHQETFLIGARNPNYNPEITEEDRQMRDERVKDGRVRKWRREIFKRDNYTCLLCGRRGVTLNAHHINSWDWSVEERFCISNGATLCQDCHISFHREYGRGKNTREQFDEWLRKNTLNHKDKPIPR